MATSFASTHGTDSGLGEGLTTEITTMVETLVNAHNEHVELFAYQGFNPITIRNGLKAKGGCGLSRDLPTLIGVCIMRGTNWKKAMQKMGTEGQTTLSKLVEKYKIAQPGARLSRTSITLGRISACYPEVVAIALHDKPSMYTGPIAQDDFPQVPPFFMIPSFASLIPAKMGHVTDGFLQVHFLMMREFDKIIHTKDASYTAEKDIRAYQTAAHTSKLMSESHRELIFSRLGMLQPAEDSDGFEMTEAAEEMLDSLDVRSVSTDVTPAPRPQVDRKRRMDISLPLSKRTKEVKK